MTAGHKGVSRGPGVRVEARLGPQPQRHIGPQAPAERALAAAAGALAALAVALGPLAPVVPAVHVSAAQVGPGLALLQAAAPREAREG